MHTRSYTCRPLHLLCDAIPRDLRANHSHARSVFTSEEEARASLLYSYKHTLNGFAALLSGEEATKLSGTSIWTHTVTILREFCWYFIHYCSLCVWLICMSCREDRGCVYLSERREMVPAHHEVLGVCGFRGRAHRRAQQGAAAVRR
jgi:hypothetical protein